MIAIVCGVFGFMIGVIFEAFVEREKRWKRNQNIRKAMQRHGEWLMSRRIFGREKPFIWLTGRKVRGIPRRGKQALESASREAQAKSPDEFLDGSFDLGDAF